MSPPEAYISLLLGNAFWTWLHRLGGPGLLIIGIIDASIVPMPGSIDAFLIILVAQRPEDWPYYALMATLGAVAGGYLTYRLGEKGEEEALERRLGQNRAKKLYQHFKMHGFPTVAAAALLPPPLPTKAVLLVAGALHYPHRNFLAALSTGRAIRYFAVGYAAHIYGHAIVNIFSRYSRPILYTFIALAILGAILGRIYLKWYRLRKKHQEQAQRG
jgi:membrane protein YqaA with SNARE-associated domain